MTSLPIGILMMVGLIALSLVDAEARVFLNVHSISLVCGGTAAILLASTPWREVRTLFKGIGGLWTRQMRIDAVNASLLGMARGARSVPNAPHGLISRACVLWEQGVDAELFEQLLHQSLDEANQSMDQAVSTLRNLSKYPPALGMIGTVMGLVTMFSQLGSDKQANMGPSLALAMTATFYGLILANALILPISDRLAILQVSQTQLNDYVFRTIILIQRGEAPTLVEDKVHAFAA